MEIEDKLEFVQRATQQMAEHTYPFIASIVGVDDSNANPYVGSAFRLRGPGRFVVTAAHVVRETIARFGALAVTAERGHEPYILGKELVRLDLSHDLAIFELPDDYPEGANSFWPAAEAEDDDTFLSSDFLFVHGFPAVRSRFSALAGGVMNRSLPYGVMRREDALPPEMLPFQFAMDFDPENFRDVDGRPAEWIDPHGLSGSAVWRIGAAGRRVEDWAPEKSVLVGVVTEWKPDAKCLVATRWTSVADFVRK